MTNNGLITIGRNALNKKIKGSIIALFNNEPLAIAQSTGSSLFEANPEAFSALTAKSSPKIPAVFLVATLLIEATSLLIKATSSSKVAISSKRAKNPEAISVLLVDAKLVTYILIKGMIEY
jgi:hypothetical protein